MLLYRIIRHDGSRDTPAGAQKPLPVPPPPPFEACPNSSALISVPALRDPILLNERTWVARFFFLCLQVSAALREREGRSSPTFFLPAVHPSSSSGGGGGEAYAFRRDTSSRGSDGSGGGGSEGVAAAAAGGGWSEEGSSSPANLTLERKRLLRLVATLALDRLQELDPLDLFKDPVPSGVAGYAEAIEFPIDFSTIRRRSQWGLYASIMDLALDVELLCANARAFNAPGTVYHTAAMYVVCCSTENLSSPYLQRTLTYASAKVMPH